MAKLSDFGTRASKIADGRIAAPSSISDSCCLCRLVTNQYLRLVELKEPPAPHLPEPLIVQEPRYYLSGRRTEQSQKPSKEPRSADSTKLTIAEHHDSLLLEPPLG